MLLIYIGLLLLGGGIIGLQLLMGHHDFDGGEVDVEAHSAAEELGAGAAALFLSVRFWSFASLAAGLCGTLCLLLKLLDGWPLALLSGSLGLLCGGAISLAMRALARDTPSASLHEQKVVGQIGRVLLPPREGSPGKVRLSVAGHVTDLFAVSEDQTLQKGDEVLVLAMRELHVEIARMDVPVNVTDDRQ